MYFENGSHFVPCNLNMFSWHVDMNLSHLREIFFIWIRMFTIIAILEFGWICLHNAKCPSHIHIYWYWCLNSSFSLVEIEIKQLITSRDYILHFDGLVQDCSNSSALAVELMQSCTKPSVYYIYIYFLKNCSWILFCRSSEWLMSFVLESGLVMMI